MVPATKPAVGTAVWAAGLLLMGGCITHRAEVVVDPEQQGQLDRGQGRSAVAVVGSAQDNWSGHSERSSPLPLELPLTMWLRDDDGRLLRGRVNPQTPRPWWQRFPADFVTDLWPREFLLLETAVVRAEAIDSISLDELEAAAMEFGYASSNKPAETADD